MDIYIKPMKKASVTGRKIVYLKDIAEVFSPNGKIDEIKSLIVLKIKDDKEKSYLISVMDIIKIISHLLPDATVNNVGEMDIIVDYKPKSQDKTGIKSAVKIVFIVIILFFGSATAIMSFHSDGEIPQILQGYYYMFFKETVKIPYILSIPYSIGLAVGIIVFFNHFARIYITKDPTPIEVQMTTYEKETVDSIIDNLNTERNKEQ